MNNHSVSSTKPKGLLAGKRFFIDPKVDKHTSFSVKQKLLALGGVSNVVNSLNHVMKNFA